MSPLTVIGEDMPPAVMPPGEDVTVYEIVPSFPVYVGAVKETVAVVLPALAEPIVGGLGFLPPESLVVIVYAAKSPTTTHVSVALLINVAYDHCARSFRPGVPFTVTPAPGTTVVCPAPVWRR